jgi:hypothetical protein
MSSVEIRSEDGHEWIRLRAEEAEHGQLPAIRVRVEAAAWGFAGADDGVWLARTALEQFLADLTTLENHRRGTAALGSMSPDGLRLTIEVVDRAGHLVVSVALAKLKYLRSGGPRAQTIAISFQADPADLPRILQQVGALPALADARGAGRPRAAGSDS